ncbi:hypothetical protein C2R55_07405 [Helicobacter pylori]|nr:hypothetical protein C2R55_07405 [Helicobacter pylori]
MGSNALLTLKPYKIPITRDTEREPNLPTLIFQPYFSTIKGLHQRIEWRTLSCFDDPLAPIIDIRP